MKTTTKLVSALVIAAATASAVPAQAAWSTRLSQPWLGHNAALLNGVSPAMLHGREVIGMNGQRLGTVVSVDRFNGSVRIRTPEGARITLPSTGLRRFGGNLFALNMTRRDLANLASRQG